MTVGQRDGGTEGKTEDGGRWTEDGEKQLVDIDISVMVLSDATVNHMCSNGAGRLRNARNLR